MAAAKIVLPDGEWAEFDLPKHLRQSDVVEIVEYAENNGIDLEGKYGIRAQIGLTNVLLTRYITDWSLTGDDGDRLPISMASLQDMPIHQFRALAVAVAPLLAAMNEAVAEPDPLSEAGSSN